MNRKNDKLYKIQNVGCLQHNTQHNWNDTGRFLMRTDLPMRKKGTPPPKKKWMEVKLMFYFCRDLIAAQ